MTDIGRDTRSTGSPGRRGDHRSRHHAGRSALRCGHPTAQAHATMSTGVPSGTVFVSVVIASLSIRTQPCVTSLSEDGGVVVAMNTDLGVPTVERLERVGVTGQTPRIRPVHGGGIDRLDLHAHVVLAGGRGRGSGTDRDIALVDDRLVLRDRDPVRAELDRHMEVGPRKVARCSRVPNRCSHWAGRGGALVSTRPSAVPSRGTPAGPSGPGSAGSTTQGFSSTWEGWGSSGALYTSSCGTIPAAMKASGTLRALVVVVVGGVVVVVVVGSALRRAATLFPPPPQPAARRPSVTTVARATRTCCLTKRDTR